MHPRFMTGDIVECDMMSTGSYHVQGMIISVQQSNSIPDADIRGLHDLQPWSYWILCSNDKYYGTRIMGPFIQSLVAPCKA